MYPISSAVKALFDAEQKQILRITGTDRNGATISITDADVMIGGFNVDRFSTTGQKLEIGTAISAQLELRLNNASGAYDDIVFEGAELFVEIGIADWSESNPTVYYIPIGYFTPDQQPRRLATISLKALDRMTRFDAFQPTLLPWKTGGGDYITDSQGNVLYFLAEVVFPKTIQQLVADICERCNVPFTQNLSVFPNYNYTVTALPNLQQKITYRTLLQWCAGIMGTCAYIDWTGELKFGWYAAADYTCTMENRLASDLYENDIEITGIAYTNAQNMTIVSGSADYTLDIKGNYMMASWISTILPALQSALSGFTYRPFAASVLSAPYLWPLDIITFTDKDGNDHDCAVTNVNFGLNGLTTIEGKGETAQSNDGIVPMDVGSEQATLIEKAIDMTEKLDSSLDQEGVFNRLTDNGAAQGIYLVDGKLYVNATYIQTGTMVADRIKGGTLTLGGLNNTDGVMRVLDASGYEIGKWDKDGITLYKGVIQGPSMVLGGLNNANGMLTVKDANGDPIGSWDEYGITIKDGSIAGPSITVGGSNDEDGTLEVKDSNGSAVVTLDSDGIRAYEGVIGPFTIGSNGLSYNRVNVTADIDYNGISFSQMLPTSGNPIEEVELNSSGLTFSINSDSVVIRRINVVGGVGLAITFGSTDYLRFSTYNQSITANADVTINGDLNVNGDVSVQNGDSGSFTTAEGLTVTVTNGIITDIGNSGAAPSLVLGRG